MLVSSISSGQPLHNSSTKQVLFADDDTLNLHNSWEKTQPRTYHHFSRLFHFYQKRNYKELWHRLPLMERGRETGNWSSLWMHLLTWPVLTTALQEATSCVSLFLLGKKRKPFQSTQQDFGVAWRKRAGKEQLISASSPTLLSSSWTNRKQTRRPPIDCNYLLPYCWQTHVTMETFWCDRSLTCFPTFGINCASVCWLS